MDFVFKMSHFAAVRELRPAYRGRFHVFWAVLREQSHDPLGLGAEQVSKTMNSVLQNEELCITKLGILH